MLSVKMNWAGGDRFEGINAFGHKIITDAPRDSGGGETGFKPTELLLYGVAGCTGVDVVRILTKQRQEIEALEIEVIGHQNDQYPKPYHTVEVKFKARGKGLDPGKLQQAIEMSESKYCVVSQTLKHETKIVTSYEIIE